MFSFKGLDSSRPCKVQQDSEQEYREVKRKKRGLKREWARDRLKQEKRVKFTDWKEEERKKGREKRGREER